jgi:hypothetical protein
MAACLLAPGVLFAQWKAPNVHTIFSGSTFANGQSQNMGPALNHTLTEFCKPGSCDYEGDPDCDTLRLGLTMHAGVDGLPGQCGWGDAASNTAVAAQEDGCYAVGNKLQDMQNQAGLEYCDQSGSGWDYEPLDDVVRVQREAIFPEAYQESPPFDAEVLSRWWERANLNLVMLEQMPQTADGDHGARVVNSLREACTSYDGEGATFPSIPTFVLGMKDNTPETSLFGGILAAAGGTAQCCYESGGCDILNDEAIDDLCQHFDDRFGHLADAAAEQQIRHDINQGNYDCGGSADLTVTGSPSTSTLPNLECALSGDKCSGAFSPEPPTDFFSIFACIQVRPQDVPADEFAVRHCHDEELNCSILREGEGLQYVDDNKTLYYLEGMNNNGTSYCTALGSGESTIETLDCPNEGVTCDTGRPGRCGVGKISCVSGHEECVQSFAPMPEICNGLDDDCDGNVDNLSTSWDNSLFSVYDADDLEDYDADGVDRTAIHCWERDVCSCAGGDPLDYGGPGYEAHIMSWQPGSCTCGEGMTDQTSSGFTSAPAGADETKAGCSAAGDGGLAAKLAALVFGALVLIGCRRREKL